MRCAARGMAIVPITKYEVRRESNALGSILDEGSQSLSLQDW